MIIWSIYKILEKEKNSMNYFKRVEMPKVVESYKQYTFLETKSGEVVYQDENQQLVLCESRTEFEQRQHAYQIAQRIYFTMRNTYFEFDYQGIRYGFPFINRESILSNIQKIENLDLVVELVQRYTNELSQLESKIESIKKGGN